MSSKRLSWSGLVILANNVLQKFISFYPFINSIAEPMDILPARGIPRFDKAAV